VIRPDFQRATVISCAAHVLLFLTALVIMGLHTPQKNRVYTISLVTPSGSRVHSAKKPQRRTPPSKRVRKTSPEERTPPAKKHSMAVKDDSEASGKKAREAIEKLRQQQEEKKAEAHMKERLKELEDTKRLDELRSRLATEGASGAEEQGSDGERNVRMKAYSDTIMNGIKDNWVFPDVGMGIRAEVSITVFADGSISINRIITPSGNRAFDQSVLKAIIKTAKVPPPPFGRNEDVILNFIPVKE